MICVSEAEKAVALANGVAAAAQIHVVHNGVRDVPPEFRASPGVRAGPDLLGGAVRRAERPRHAAGGAGRAARARVVARIDRRRSADDAHAAAGRAPGNRRTRDFRGYQPDPEPALAAAQIFVLSTRSEALPRRVLEAMRAGLPVVASDVGGVGEAVTHGVTGLLAPPEDAGVAGGGAR